MVTTIILVRHCEAEGNINGEFHGQYDADVTEKGKRQLEQLAARFGDMPIDALYSSPLRRAKLTAQAVNAAHDLPIRFDDRLQEIDGGALEQLSWTVLPERYPAAADAWANRPHEFAAPDGETMRQVYDRMCGALLDIAAAHEGQTVAVATHGCPIRCALCWARTGGIEALVDTPWCDNTALTTIAIENGEPRLLARNDVAHLA